MRTKMRKLVFHIAFAAVAAVVTPAAAAGIVQGVAAGAEIAVAINDATPTASPVAAPGTAVSLQDLASESHTATAAPRRLNLMAGNDDIAWANVGKKVHVAKKK